MPPENLPAPLIDYLAKDYSSFRRLMLDRLSTVMPNWAERNPADLGVALVEAIAERRQPKLLPGCGRHGSLPRDGAATHLGPAACASARLRHA